jgi:hypothetical protein
VHFTRIERIASFLLSPRTMLFTFMAVSGGWLAALLVAKVTRARFMGGLYLHCVGYAHGPEPPPVQMAADAFAFFPYPPR